MAEVLSFEQLKKCSCFQQVNFLREQIGKKFVIPQANEMYIMMDPADINTFLFVLFGDFDTLNTPKYQNLYSSIKKNSKSKLRQLFKEITQPKIQEGQFINRIRLHIEKFKIHQELLQRWREVWDKVTPQILSRKYSNSYFKLSKYSQSWAVPNIDQVNKRVLVLPFQEDGKVMMCFFETAKQFSTQQIDQICQKLGKKQIIAEKKPIKSISQPIKLSKKSSDQTDEEIDLGELVQKNKNFWKDNTTLFFLACILILSLLTFNSFVLYPIEQRGHIEPLGPIHEEIVYYKQQIERYVVDPLCDKILQLQQYLSEQSVQYFANPLQKVTQCINTNYPSIENCIEQISNAGLPSKHQQSSGVKVQII